MDVQAKTIDALVRRIRPLIEAVSAEPRKLARAALEVEHIVLGDLLTPEEERSVLESREIARLRRDCQQAFCSLESQLERSVALIALRASLDLIKRPDMITQPYLMRYHELARREVEFAKIRRDDHVLFLGSGPLPISAIEYYWQTGCRVCCVECDESAVRDSREIVGRLGLEEFIEIRHDRAEAFDAGKYSVAILGVLARPKTEIAAQLSRTCAANARVICRTTLGLRQLIYAPTFEREVCVHPFHVVSSNKAVGEQVLSGILMLGGAGR